MNWKLALSIRPRIAIGCIAAVAFFVRLLHVLSYSPEPSNDMAVYVDMAVRRLSLANLFSIEGICWFPPGYALFLKPFFLLLGPEAALRAAQIGQAALGGWTCVLIYLLARRLHSRRAGIAAALATCFYAHFVFYSSVFLSETLFTALFFAGILRFLRAAERPGGWSAYSAGLLSGAALLVRPVAAALAPAALLAAWRASRNGRGRLRAAALILAGGLTLVGPWAVRNWIAYEHLVVISPNGPFNLAIGNHPDARGGYTEPPSIVGDIWARREHFRQQAVGFATNDPWGALFVTARLKWKEFWSLIPPWPLFSSNPMLYYGEHFFPYVPWMAALVAGIGGVGAMLAHRRALWWVTPACFATYTACYMAFFGDTRFRLPAEGFFLAWGGVAAATLAAALPGVRRARARNWAAAAGVLLVLILAQSGSSAAAARSRLRDPESRIAVSGQIPVLKSRRAIPLFGEEPLPLDRSRGRFLRLTFNAYRMGPSRDTPENGRVRITFLDREGRPLNWLENTAYALEALPADRWVEVGFKAHIPPQARSCRVEILPDRGSPDTVILDQGILRYALGNDPALEGLFPYLRYRE